MMKLKDTAEIKWSELDSSEENKDNREPVTQVVGNAQRVCIQYWVMELR